jgi:hypothetical protein
MALNTFHTGRFRGKLGVIVGECRKGTYYIKTYGKPTDPRSDEQIAIRSVFKKTPHIAWKI